jgi:hypothetical protein
MNPTKNIVIRRRRKPLRSGLSSNILIVITFKSVYGDRRRRVIADIG